MVGIWLPFLDAYEAGLWLFWICEREIVAVPHPSLRITDDRLHCEDGPAVAWPDGKRYWFWRGVQVPRDVIEEPSKITVRRIFDEANAEVRRVMTERYGQDRYLRDAGGEIIQEDDSGKLWRLDEPRVELETPPDGSRAWLSVGGEEPLVMVEVVNSTAEPDGSFKTYFLRVPPDVQTARQAVAWTFDVDQAAWEPAVET